MKRTMRDGKVKFPAMTFFFINILTFFLDLIKLNCLI